MKVLMFNKFSFKQLILGVTAIIFVVLTLSLAIISSLVARSEMKTALYQQGLQMSRKLADDSITPLLFESASSAENILDILIGVRGVTEVSIINSAHEKLVSRASLTHIIDKYPNVDLTKTSEVKETDDGWYYSVLVTTDKLLAKETDVLFDISPQHKVETIGVVHLTLSKEGISKSQRRIFFNNLFVSTFIALALLIIMSFLLTRITQPLEKLSQLMKQGQLGDYREHAVLSGPREIFDISCTYNIMIQAISEREQNLSLTLNSIGEGIIVCDNNGIVTRMNPEAERLTLKKSIDAIGEKFDEVLCFKKNDELQNTIIPLEKIIETATGTSYANPFELITANNSKKLITLSSKPIINPSNQLVIGVITVLTDVTEKQKQEDIIRRTQKLDALGKLTGGIAHDYNNMLGVMMGYAGLLQQEIGDQEKHVKYIDEILNACNRGVNLTRKLLTFSRNVPSKNELTDINEILSNEKDMLQKTLTARINIIYDLGESIENILVNPADFDDAIINMSINAMHSMPNGGQITIKTRNKLINEDEVAGFDISAGKYVSISITDTGCGIEKDKLEFVFDPFYSTKGSMGTGLGLSQVHGFVTRSHGMIRIYSEVDHGTQITMYFPVTSDHKEKNEVQIDDSDLDLSGNERILVVDDEPALRSLAETVLVEKGYTVFTAENGESALQFLNTQTVDLVLSDIIMPGIDGFQLSDEINRYFPEILVQLTSGFTDNRVGGVEHITSILFKPYNYIALLKAVRKLLDSR